MAQDGRTCRCGCGRRVTKTFAPGHDQKYVSKLRTLVVTRQLTRVAAIGRARRISPSLGSRVSRAIRAADSHPLTQ